MKNVRCDSHCKYPAYDKEEIDDLMKEIKEQIPNIYNGIEEPSESVGVDGDVYFQYVED